MKFNLSGNDFSEVRMIFIKFGLMLWALVVLLLVLPFVVLEALYVGVPIRGQLRVWASYFPANGWTFRKNEN